MAKKKSKSNGSYTAMPMSMRKHSSVSIEKVDNGYIVRWCDYSGKMPKDVTHVAKDEAEAKQIMTKMIKMPA